MCCEFVADQIRKSAVGGTVRGKVTDMAILSSSGSFQVINEAWRMRNMVFFW